MASQPAPRDRPVWARRMDGAWRLALLHTVARWNGSLLVSEFPKSGGTWLCQMLSQATGIPFPRNAPPGSGRALFHGHYTTLFSGVRTIILWRDPRDVMVSWYHHTLVKTPLTHQAVIDRNRARTGISDPANVRTNLPRFLEAAFTPGLITHYSWNQFFDVWWKRDGVAVHTSYEALRRNPEAELARIISLAGLDASPAQIAEAVTACSFDRMAGRKAGQTDTGSFLRKGIVGDWSNHFSPESIAKLNTLAGDRLTRIDAFLRTQAEAQGALAPC